MAEAGDVLVDFVTGQLAAFAGLGALGHFDLQLVGVGQVSMVTPKRPEATCLMARRRFEVAVRQSGLITRRGSSPPSPVLLLPPMRFMAMARVSWASRRDRAERHGAGAEAFDDLLGGLDFFDGDGWSARRLEFEEAAEVHSGGLLVDGFGVAGVGFAGGAVWSLDAACCRSQMTPA